MYIGSTDNEVTNNDKHVIIILTNQIQYSHNYGHNTLKNSIKTHNSELRGQEEVIIICETKIT